MTTTNTRYDTCSYRYSDGHLCGVFRMNHTGERAAGHRFTEQQPSTTPPVSGAGSESARWYYIKWYEVDLRAYPQEPKFAIEQGETLLGVVLEEEIAKRIISDHGQHSTLIEQRDQLVRVLRRARAAAQIRSDLNQRLHGRPTNESWVTEADAVLTTIEQEGETRG